jgi:hypothetical protein
MKGMSYTQKASALPIESGKSVLKRKRQTSYFIKPRLRPRSKLRLRLKPKPRLRLIPRSTPKPKPRLRSRLRPRPESKTMLRPIFFQFYDVWLFVSIHFP